VKKFTRHCFLVRQHSWSL